MLALLALHYNVLLVLFAQHASVVSLVSCDLNNVLDTLEIRTYIAILRSGDDSTSKKQTNRAH